MKTKVLLAAVAVAFSFAVTSCGNQKSANADCNRCRFLLRCKNRTGMRLCKESLLQGRLSSLPEGCLR